MNSIDIRSYKDTDSIPLLILVDLQQEYLCQNRPLGLKDTAATVSNCIRLLTYARSARIPIAFVRWSQPGKLFHRGSSFSGWIDGCTPHGSDMVFERAWPSCYESTEFSEMMDDGGGRNAVIAGFTGAIACIATMIEGVPRQHRFTFIEDASASHAHQGKSEAAMHQVACSLISLYARVEKTENWVHAQECRQPSGFATNGF